MNQVDNLVSNILHETSAPRLYETNPDLKKQFAKNVETLKRVLKHSSDVAEGEIEETSISFKINNPYTKKEMNIPVKLYGMKTGSMGVGINDVLKGTPTIYISVPGIFGAFIDASGKHKTLEDFLWPTFVHELVHVIDPTVNSHTLDKYNQVIDDSNAHYSSKIERNAYMLQIVTILKQAIDEGKLKKDDVIDALRRGNDEQVKDWIDTATDEAAISSALLYWYKQPNIMREVRMRLYSALT